MLKVLVFSLPEMIMEIDVSNEGPLLEMLTFPLLFQIGREPRIPLIY